MVAENPAMAAVVPLCAPTTATLDRISPPSEPSPPAFAPVDVVGGRSVPLRFPAGAVLEIPEDRPDLMRIAIESVAGIPQPC